MNNNLFNKPSNEIKYEDIKTFCDSKIRETETVDYKRELNQGIIETIAAMSNTDGGIILVGIEEEKNNKSIPNEIVGIPEQKGNSIQQQIANWCIAYLNPVYYPEVIYIQIPESDGKYIILIRIDKQQIFELPIFHREKGILIRIGEENRPADPSHIRKLFVDNEKIQKNEDFYNWLQDKMYHLDKYCSINVALKIPMKSFDKISMWHDEEIQQLEEIVKHHKNGNTWLSYFYPLDVLRGGIYIPTVKIKRDSADLVTAKPSLTGNSPQGQTFFVEDIENSPSVPSVTINKLYRIYFDVHGYMLATVKFILDQTNFSLDIFIETISAVIDLFEKVISSRIYISQVSEGSKYHIFFEIYNVPQKIDVPFECKRSENNLIPPVKKEELIYTLNNFELLKDFIGYFLAEKGYIGYEKNLETYLKI